MNCPKCSATLRGETTMSRTYDGETPFLAVNALSCWRCGWWQAEEFKPIRPKTAEMTNQMGKTKFKPKVAGFELVKDFYESITQLRKQKTAWKTISGIIKQATGRPIKPNTVQRNYNLITMQGAR